MPTTAAARAASPPTSAASSASGSTATSVLTGELGYNFRKNPEDPVVAHVPNFLRWGGGVGITPNDHWLIHGELLGRAWQRDTTSLDGVIVAEDGTVSPIVSETDRTTSFTTGVTWFATNGFFIGGELRWDTPTQDAHQRIRRLQRRLRRLSRPHRLGPAPHSCRHRRHP